MKCESGMGVRIVFGSDDYNVGVRARVCLSVCPSVRSSACPSVRPSICLSVCELCVSDLAEYVQRVADRGRQSTRHDSAEHQASAVHCGGKCQHPCPDR